ncbi:MAG TPA: hypothetical protein VID19_10495 [Candidatus Eremiobacteraceae bacterium]
MFCLALALAAVLDLQYDVYVGDETQPVNTGVVWLLRYSWYGPVWVQVGAIAEGRASIAIDTGAVPGLTDRDARRDDHYVVAFELPDAQWYVSRPVDNKRFVSDVPAAIATVGTVVEGARGAPPALGLARSDARTITLLNVDGTPAKNVTLEVSVHVSNQDHCGAEQGPELGKFETDQAGVITLHAPPEPLFLGAEYFNDVGGRLHQESGIIVGSSRDIAIKRTWNLPAEVVALTVLDNLGRPEAGHVVESKIRADTCGAHFGPVGTTDAHGVAKVSLKRLAVDQVWVDLPGARRRTLTPAEMQMLFSRGSATIHV